MVRPLKSQTPVQKANIQLNLDDLDDRKKRCIFPKHIPEFIPKVVYSFQHYMLTRCLVYIYMDIHVHIEQSIWSLYTIICHLHTYCSHESL